MTHAQTRKNKPIGKLLDNTKHTFSKLGNKIKGGQHKTVDEEFKKMEDLFDEQKKKN